jgi:WD40 repeat protein
MGRFAKIISVGFLACLFGTLFNFGQETCPAPPALTPSTGLNIFTDELEMELGTLVAAGIEHDLPLVHGPLNDHLQEIGERLLKQMPPTKMQFHFVLIDASYVNAFALPGGHVYVSRKLVIAANTEDELAGVVSHEIGHIITHQSAIEFSRIFRQLGIDHLNTKQDVISAYNKLLDSKAKLSRSGGGSHEESEHQGVADQIGVYGSMRAGYRAQSYADFWDRVTENHGKTGNWASDFFGATKPESKRLREILRYAASLPGSCLGAPAMAADFAAWKQQVLQNSISARKEVLPGLVSKKVLNPPLRSDVFQLAFSPDGKYVLAQDDANVYIFKRDPFIFIFGFEAKEAYAAHFTPDSKQVLLHSSKLRIERWDLEKRARIKVNEVVRFKGCLQSELSRTGAYLSCYDDENTLTVVDVETGDVIFTQKNFYTPSTLAEVMTLIFAKARLELEESADIHIIEMKFSPDDHYFIASRWQTSVAFDLTTKAKTSLPGSVRYLLGTSFTFMGPDKLAGLGENSGKSKVVRFPSGETISEMTLSRNTLQSAARGNYLLIRPIKDYPVAIFDIAQNKILQANRRSAMDVYDDNFIVETSAGELAIYDMASSQRLAFATLPRSSFGRITAFSTSPDFRYLAISEKNRGALWDLEQNRRVFHIRGFRGAYASSNGTAFLDFPEFEKKKRSIAELDIATGDAKTSRDVEEGKSVSQFGRYITSKKANGRKDNYQDNVSLEVSDVESNKLLWSRVFPKVAPVISVYPDENTMVFAFSLSEKFAQEEAKMEPRLAEQLANMKDSKSSGLLEVVDATTGTPKGKMIVDTGKNSFRVLQVRVAGDWVALSDNHHRVMVYSLSTGELKGRLPGESAVLSLSAGLIAVDTEQGKVVIYDLPGLQKRSEISAPSAFSIAKFSSDGKQMLFITQDQTVYLFDVAKILQSSVAMADAGKTTQ